MTHPAYGELRPVTAQASVLLARNPSPMTLDGTNTWLLRAPGHEAGVVVDAGEDDAEHLALVADCGPVELVLLTHRHHDHAGGAARLAALTGAPVRALDPTLVLGSEALADGDVVAAAGVELRVLGTPGHTSDSLCFLLDGPDTEPAVLTGDTILGRGTTVIAHPDGALTAGNAWTRSARRSPRWAPTRPPARWWSWSTPTWTARSGRPPSGRCGPSWTTSGRERPAVRPPRPAPGRPE